jgi:hypothetical protein
VHRTCASLSIFIVLAWTSGALGGELEELSWLSGCWANPQGEAGSGEYWQPLAGGTMLGVGRTVRNGKTVDYEFLRLHEDESGRVIYTATPARQSETPFMASQISEAGATFENPAHDFPQKITYAREDAENMVVRIEGERQGKARAFELRFTRVACPA